MNRKLITILVTLGLVLAIVVPVAAITYGEPDVGEHPYVGLIAFYDANGEFVWRCSGALIAPNLVLTAGHCTAPDDVVPVSARVYFDETIYYDPIADDYTNPVFYTGIPLYHPLYNWADLPRHHDIGVVVLDEDVPGITEYGELPPLYIMDEVGAKGDKRDVILTPVGYGVNDMYPDQISLRTRYQAQSFLINLVNAVTDGWSMLSSNNPGQWQGSEDYVTGGTCFGDSGGPVFLGDSESNLIVGINSFVMNGACSGVNGSFRVDIPASLDWLALIIDEYGIVMP